MDNEVEYLYTVHDCIGCLVSDTEKVKEIMERTAKEMYSGAARPQNRRKMTNSISRSGRM